MTNWLIYWVIGCLIVGAGWGMSLKKCPNDKLELLSYQTLVLVAVWPAVFTASWTMPDKKYECKEAGHD